MNDYESELETNPFEIKVGFVSLRDEDPLLRVFEIGDKKDVEKPNAIDDILGNTERIVDEYQLDEKQQEKLRKIGKEGIERYKNNLISKINLNNNIKSGANSEYLVGDFTKERCWVDTRSKSLKHGRFTQAEDQKLRDAIYKYFEDNGYTKQEGWDELCLVNRRNTNLASPWPAICSVLPHRHMESCLTRAQAHLYPWPKKGKWSEPEKCFLVKIVDDYTANNETKISWPSVSRILVRYHKHCRDMYQYLKSTNQINYYRGLSDKYLDNEKIKDEFQKDYYITRKDNIAWTKEQEEKLLAEVRKCTGLEWPISNISWSKVALAMNGIAPQQCRVRYLDHMIGKQGPVSNKSLLFKRQIIRHLYIILEHSPNITWNEIDWECLPKLWTKNYCSNAAKKILSNHLNLKSTTDWDVLIFQSDHWKQAIRALYEKFECAKHESEDAAIIELTTKLLDNGKTKMKILKSDDVNSILNLGDQDEQSSTNDNVVVERRKRGRPRKKQSTNKDAEGLQVKSRSFQKTEDSTFNANELSQSNNSEDRASESVMKSDKIVRELKLANLEEQKETKFVGKRIRVSKTDKSNSQIVDNLLRSIGSPMGRKTSKVKEKTRVGKDKEKKESGKVNEMKESSKSKDKKEDIEFKEKDEIILVNMKKESTKAEEKKKNSKPKVKEQIDEANFKIENDKTKLQKKASTTKIKIAKATTKDKEQSFESDSGSESPIKISPSEEKSSESLAGSDVDSSEEETDEDLSIFSNMLGIA